MSRTPSACSRPATRRLSFDFGIRSMRPAAAKPPFATTCEKKERSFRSSGWFTVIIVSNLERYVTILPPTAIGVSSIGSRVSERKETPMEKVLSGKVALVTGGSRGIGAATARALANEGANVAISYVASPDKAEAVVAELKANGVNARAYKADQASAVDVDQLVKNVAKDFGRLDILVNNAGVAAGGAVDDPNADVAALTRLEAV